MKTLHSKKQYDELYALIAKMVNKVDPCFYGGPDDEYDSYINRLLSLIRDHKLNKDNLSTQLKDVFFGTNVIQDTERERLDKLGSIFKEELRDWM